MAVLSAAEAAEAPQVLIVDDLAINRLVLRRVMLRLGFRVLEASSGVEALRVIAREPLCNLACVLMDLKMPGLNGWDTTQRLRALERLQDQEQQSAAAWAAVAEATARPAHTAYGTPHTLASTCTWAAPPRSHVPIIACTATNPDELVACVSDSSTPLTVTQSALLAGMDQVLHKPVPPHVMERTLDALLPHWRGAVAAATARPAPATPVLPTFRDLSLASAATSAALCYTGPVCLPACAPPVAAS